LSVYWRKNESEYLQRSAIIARKDCHQLLQATRDMNKDTSKRIAINATQKSLLFPGSGAFALGMIFGSAGFAIGAICSPIAAPFIYWTNTPKDKKKISKAGLASLISGGSFCLSLLTGGLGYELHMSIHGKSAADKTIEENAPAPGKTITENEPGQEKMKTYFLASGTEQKKYLDQDRPTDIAKFVVVKSGSGTVEQVLIGTGAGSHWNIDACNADQAYSHLYSIRQGGSKDTKYAGIRNGKYCNIGYDKDGEVLAVSVTEVAAEEDPVAGFKSCPSSVECYLFTVKSKWAPTTSTEPTPDKKDMEAIDGFLEKERTNAAQESFDRKWAEGQVEDLKKACRMGQKHWTLCPDD
jgi:hypothetical protein